MAQNTFVDGDVLTASEINTYLAGEGGAWTSWTPVIDQAGTVAATNTRSRNARYGRTIHFSINMSVTGTGTSSTAISISLPFTAAAAGTVIGAGSLFDSSSSNIYPFLVYVSATGSMQLWTTSTDGTATALGSTVFTAALASGDTIRCSGTYEAAS